MGPVERVGAMVLGVLAIILTILLAIVVLTVCVTKEWFFQMFPGLDAKYSSPDYVRDQPDD
ncbi:conserved protein of unknown function [Acidithiobacillus ferrivorans]|uniref:Uncharacterized protein n=1 Tax=Acidithiobacillus ferrivorans TaxID=160808 RepID=A0A060UV51_9PROT|nr:conserved hypothetical protein [Acidithiobacillus ferrivorans]SMH64681.1 conserved protein of unknown function [Acidithiobacillus ferrivorans]